MAWLWMWSVVLQDIYGLWSTCEAALPPSPPDLRSPSRPLQLRPADVRIVRSHSITLFILGVQHIPT